MVGKTAAKARVRVGRPLKSGETDATARIIEAAFELFATHGFAGTSMEQVAARCGAGKDTVYRRFSSKVALFEAVVADAHRRAIQRVEQLPGSIGSPLDQLKSLLFKFLQINMEPDLIAFKRITLSEAVVFARKGPIPSQPDPLMERLTAAVTSCQAHGSIRQGDASDIATHLIHCLVALPTSVAMMGGDQYNSPEAVAAHFDAVWEWLLHGVARK